MRCSIFSLVCYNICYSKCPKRTQLIVNYIVRIESTYNLVFQFRINSNVDLLPKLLLELLPTACWQLVQKFIIKPSLQFTCASSINISARWSLNETHSSGMTTWVFLCVCVSLYLYVLGQQSLASIDARGDVWRKCGELVSIARLWAGHGEHHAAYQTTQFCKLIQNRCRATFQIGLKSATSRH